MRHLKIILFYFLCVFIITLLMIIFPGEAAYAGHNCSTSAPNSTSTFKSNLNQLLSDLSSNDSRTGFYNATVGPAYGLFLCCGDAYSPNYCRDCVSNLTSEALLRCPDREEAVIWYDDCTLRYSNQPFSSSAATLPVLVILSQYNLTQYVEQPQKDLNKVLATSLDALVPKVANASDKYATGVTTFRMNRRSFKMYILGQCMPDLSAADCNGCLREAAVQLQPSYCGGKQGVRVLYPSCNVRFDMHSFYQVRIIANGPPVIMIVEGPPAPLPAPETPLLLPPSSRPSFPPLMPPSLLPLPPSVRKNRKRDIYGPSKPSSMIIASIVVPVAFGVLVGIVAGCFFRKKLRRVRDRYIANRQKKKVGNDMKTAESLQFDLVTVETATKKFSHDNKLGEGGFGAVFKGTLGNGQEIAVKRLSKSSTQGVQEFKNEVVLVAKLQHRNLVRLLGFCLEGEETLLVYEYVPNKSLDHFLLEPKKREELDWSRRCMIIGGIARGILYLHEDSRLRVIHRDLKASNILLDGDMNPKNQILGWQIKMFGVDQTQGNTKRIVGTLGYMAPEYAMEGLYSVKSDVFSFGILLLEIAAGRKNFLGFDLREPTLVAYAWQLWNEGKGLELMDPLLLKDSCNIKEFLRYIHIGLLCVQEDANNRPTMSSVVLMLKSETISLSKPERPAFFTGRSTNNHYDQTGADACTVNGLTISDDLPR